jgi:hypothetical protein
MFIAQYPAKKKAERLYSISHNDMFKCSCPGTWDLNRSCAMNPRKKVGEDPIWNHGELPPSELIESLHLERVAINQDEFSRAEWFWNRRPKLVCENLIFLFCYIVVFVCLLYLVPESFPPLLVWIFVGVSCVFVDCVRLDGSRTEYESSIKRVFAHLSESDN